MNRTPIRTLAAVLAVLATAGMAAAIDAIAHFEQARAASSQNFVGTPPVLRS